jgi:hypothetical protein
MNKLQKKKVEQITNFIVNNITLAEVSSLVVERASETAEFIVKNELDPKDFNSAIARKKLYKKIVIKDGKVQIKEEKSWYDNLLNKIGIRKEEKKEKKVVTLTTKNTKG